jgi:hypothetical protein
MPPASLAQFYAGRAYKKETRKMITVKVTDSGIQEALTRISRRMADPSPVMLAISEALKD